MKIKLNIVFYENHVLNNVQLRCLGVYFICPKMVLIMNDINYDECNNES